MSTEKENIDYKQTLNVTEVHSSVEREGKYPESRREPLPLWIFIGCMCVVFLAGGYLKVNGFDMHTFVNPGNVPGSPLGDGGGASGVVLSPEEKWLKAGKQIFKISGACASCHGAGGTGTQVFPPLVDSEWVINSDERLSMIILKGVSGHLVVKGVPYNGVMPPQGGGNLSDKQIAQLMSYIRNEWGNEAPFVTEENVSYARKKYEQKQGAFTQEDLEQIPVDQMLPGAEFGEGETELPAAGDGA